MVSVFNGQYEARNVIQMKNEKLECHVAEMCDFVSKRKKNNMQYHDQCELLTGVSSTHVCAIILVLYFSTDDKLFCSL